MDRLAAHVVATAVLTAALAAVPTAMAANSTLATTAATPSPKPTTSASTSLSASGSAAASASPSAPTSTPAQPAVPVPSKRSHTEPLPCPDAHQIGTTAYARWHGTVAFSVKLYYSTQCRETYGYAYPWLQFRMMKVHYDLGMGVFDVTHDAIDGARTFVGGAGGPDFWSSPVTVAAGTCTQALAHVFYPDTETDTFTDKICV